jgi:hypothetical protein
MKRTNLLIGLGLLVSGAVAAQSVTSVRIGTSFTSLSGANPVFYVDGTGYTSPQTFVWPIGSKHIVQFLLSTDNGGNALNYQSVLGDSIRYTFTGWTTNSSVTLSAGSNAVQTVSADPGLTSLIAQTTVQYRVHLSLPNSGTTSTGPCGGAPGNAPQDGFRQGVIYFQGSCFSDSTNVLTDPFVAPGTYPLNAFPYPGWVFYGWQIGNNPPNYLTSITIAGPTNILAMFSIAKRVNFITDPPGLQILVDGAVINTPPASSQSSDGVTCAPDYTRLPPGAPAGFQPLCLGQFDFLPGSKHTVGAPPTQLDTKNKYWVFHALGNGAGQNSVYTAPTNTAVPDTMSVSFVPGVHVSILTNP